MAGTRCLQLFIFFILSGWINLSNAAQSIVLLNDPHRVYSLNEYIEVLTDESNGLSYQEISSGDYEDKFIPNISGVPNYGFTDAAYWVRFKVLNNLDENEDWLLEVAQPQLNSIKLFYVKPNGLQEIKTTGDHYPFDQREINHPFFLIPLELEHQQITTFYVRVQSRYENISLPLRIVPMKTFSEQDSTRQFIIGTFYGLLIMVFFINFFLFISGKNINYLLYVCYIIAIGLLQFSLNGLVLKYLNTDSIFWGNNFNLIAASLVFITVLIFTKSFLNSRLYIPTINKILNILLILSMICLVISFFPSLYRIANLLIHFSAIIVNLGVLVAGMATFMKGFKPARFFMIAFFFLIAGVFLYILKNFGVVPSMIITEYGIQIGSSFQVIMLSFALADRIKILQEREQRSQKEIKLKLETKVEERTTEVTRQKEIIERKNKDITDSINYAKRIQETILPDIATLQSILPESFIYYQPKDIVSGDFYWFTKTRSQEVIVVAMDCTGHGVPGAFMSMIGNDSLNQIIVENMITDPAQILNVMNERVTKILKQRKENTTTKDGMDLALCKIDLADMKITFAGANRPVYLLRNGSLNVTKGDKLPVGGYDRVEKMFNNKEIKIQEGDIIYLFSDGYVDQFGGELNKKFMTRRFKKLLIENSNLSMDEQKEQLVDVFYDWMRDEDQIDDILVMGIKF